MSVLLLVVALAVPVEAPKADMKEATAAVAAVASVEVLPEVSIICAAETAPPQVCAIPAVGTVAQAAAPGQPVWEPVSRRGSCGLLALYTRNSFLSGPWGAARRLAAARRLGDADEIRRMEAKLAALLAEALETSR